MSKIVLAGLMAALFCSHDVMAQTPIPPSPVNFVMDAAQIDHYEIQAAHAAMAQSQDSRVQSFAQSLLQDHGRLSGALRQAASAAGLAPPPSGLSGDQARLLAALQGVRGVDFDRAFVQQQVLVHAQAVAVDESFSRDGINQDLQQFAQAALPTVRSHLEKAQQLRSLFEAK